MPAELAHRRRESDLAVHEERGSMAKAKGLRYAVIRDDHGAP